MKEKLLAIDAVAIREAYIKFEINRVGLVWGEYNPAEGLTNLKHNGTLDRIVTK